MNLKRRLVVVGLMGLAMTGVATAASPAQAATGHDASVAVATVGDVTVASWHRVWCDPTTAGYNQCVAVRRQLIREGYQVTAIHYNPPGCTQVEGCRPGYYFDYWF